MLRLKTRSQFKSVLDGQIVSKTDHFALHKKATTVQTLPAGVHGSDISAKLFTPGYVWLGAMVPKRWAKRAVTRNAIKRQIYCIAELLSDTLSVDAYVVRLRKGFDRSMFISATSDILKQAVRVEIELLLNKSVHRLKSGS